MTASAGWTRPIETNVPTSTLRHMIDSPLRGVEPAHRLGPIAPERIELRELMQKAGLRRDRHDHATVAQQDRLAQLQVPVAQGQLLPLERGERESGALEEIERRLRFDAVQVRVGFAD